MREWFAARNGAGRIVVRVAAERTARMAAETFARGDVNAAWLDPDHAVAGRPVTEHVPHADNGLAEILVQDGQTHGAALLRFHDPDAVVREGARLGAAELLDPGREAAPVGSQREHEPAHRQLALLEVGSGKSNWRRTSRAKPIWPRREMELVVILLPGVRSESGTAATPADKSAPGGAWAPREGMDGRP
jgi:hypothetical protein